MTREEIERLWVQESDGYSYGYSKPLCSLMFEVGNSDLIRRWDKIWYSQKYNYISDYFDDGYYDYNPISSEDYYVLSYLLRALSLNILLDDNL